VDPEGTLKTHRPGLVTVTATTGQHRASTLVTVLAPEVAPEAPKEITKPRIALDWRSFMPALDRRLLIAAALVIALLGGFALVWAAFSGDDTPTQGNDLAGPIALPPPAPPPVAPESVTIAQDTTVPDTASPPPVVTPPPAPPPPPDSPPVVTGIIRIAGTLPQAAEVLIRGGGTVRRWNGRDLAVPPGSYQVEARASGYEEARTDLRVQAGATAVWTPTLTRIVVTPPPSAPPPAPKDTSASAPSAEAAVRVVIQNFVGVLQRRDVDAVTPRNAQWVGKWRRLFEEPSVRNLEARLESVTNFTQTGATARASFTVTLVFADAGGPKRAPIRFDAEFQLGTSGWAMTAFTEPG
jgi:hypothetical protein